MATVLDLRSVNIRQLSEVIIPPATEVVDLSHNQLEGGLTYDECAAVFPCTIKRLDLSYNPRLFAGEEPCDVGPTPSLEKLCLSCTSFRGDGLICSDNTKIVVHNSLRSLDLSKCPITQLVISADEFPALRSLILSYSEIGPDGECIIQLPSLSTIFLQNCGLTQIPHAVAGLSDLESIDLSLNKFDHFEVPFSELFPRLRTLDISQMDTVLSTESLFPGVFHGLDTLFAEGCALSHIHNPNWWEKLAQAVQGITALYLRGTFITQDEPSVIAVGPFDVPSLMELDLSLLPLPPSVPASLAGCCSLRVLRLDGCKLESVAFPYLPQLTELSLSYNRLVSVTGTLPSLQRLSLCANRFPQSSEADAQRLAAMVASLSTIITHLDTRGDAPFLVAPPAPSPDAPIAEPRFSSIEEHNAELHIQGMDPDEELLRLWRAPFLATLIRLIALDGVCVSGSERVTGTSLPPLPPARESPVVNQVPVDPSPDVIELTVTVEEAPLPSNSPIIPVSHPAPQAPPLSPTYLSAIPDDGGISTDSDPAPPELVPVLDLLPTECAVSAARSVLHALLGVDAGESVADTVDVITHRRDIDEAFARLKRVSEPLSRCDISPGSSEFLALNTCLNFLSPYDCRLLHAYRLSPIPHSFCPDDIQFAAISPYTSRSILIGERPHLVTSLILPRAPLVVISYRDTPLYICKLDA